MLVVQTRLRVVGDTTNLKKSPVVLPSVALPLAIRIKGCRIVQSLLPIEVLSGETLLIETVPISFPMEVRDVQLTVPGPDLMVATIVFADASLR